MKIKFTKEALQNAVNAAGNAMSTTGIIPQLLYILIKQEDNDVVMYAGDNDLKIRYVIPSDQVDVKENGELCVEYAYIKEIIKKAGENDVTIETSKDDSTVLVIKVGKSKFKLNTIRVQDYPKPDLTLDKTAPHFTMKAEDLKSIMSCVAITCAVKETRPSLTGVNFSMHDGVLTATATDSYRLSRKIYKGFDSANDFKVTVPKTSLKSMLDIFKKSETVNVYVESKRIILVTNNMVVSSCLLDGAYPDVDRLIPTDFCYTIKANREELLAAVDRASFLKEDNVSLIRIKGEADCGMVSISCKTQEIGEFQQDIPNAKFESYASNGTFEIAVSGSFIIDALKSYDCENVQFKLNGALKPFVVIDENDETVVQLLLPTRIYG